MKGIIIANIIFIFNSIICFIFGYQAKKHNWITKLKGIIISKIKK